MIIHVKEFVYGNIVMSKNNSPDSRELTDDYGNRMTIRIGDKLLCANNNVNQSWIQEEELTGFDNNEDQRINLNGISIHVGGEAYIGRV